MISRRSFIEYLAAIAGVSAVPALGVVLPSVSEPDRWAVEAFDLEYSHGVGAVWGTGPNMIRHAVSINTPSLKISKQEIEFCKQALRQWYYERHILKKAA